MLFGKTKGAAAPAKRQGKDEFNGLLGAGSNYEGRLKFEGMVRLDCTFKGEIESNGTLVLGPDASVEGNITVGTLVSSGAIRGRVDAGFQATLNKSSSLEGELNAPKLAVEEGAMLVGKVVMGDSAKAIPAPTTTTVTVESEEAEPAEVPRDNEP